MPVAIITGAPKGLGRALAKALAERGCDLVLDARGAEAPADAAGGPLRVRHARDRPAPVRLGRSAPSGAGVGGVAAGRVDLLVLNASALGAEPLVRWGPGRGGGDDGGAVRGVGRGR